jgi:hypothetical protein
LMALVKLRRELKDRDQHRAEIVNA